LSAAGGQPATTSLERPFRFNNYNTCPPKAPLLPGRPGLIEILGPIMHRSMQGLQEFMRQNCNIVNLSVWNVPMVASLGYVMIKVGDLFFDPRDIMPHVMGDKRKRKIYDLRDLATEQDTNQTMVDEVMEGEALKKHGEPSWTLACEGPDALAAAGYDLLAFLMRWGILFIATLFFRPYTLAAFLVRILVSLALAALWHYSRVGGS
jgi:hypothetical protein